MNSPELLTSLLADWRRWLLAALLGALIGLAVYALAPPPFRARATVVVDQNVEEAWVYFPDRQLFQFLRRETDRLVALAWSDAVLAEVASQVAGLTVPELRDGLLQLSQPADGGWHFYAQHADAPGAARLADAWAGAFVAAAGEALEASPELLAARQALDALVAAEPDANDPQLRELTDRILALAERTKGISPYVELYQSEQAATPTERVSSRADYLLVGSLGGALLAALLSLFQAGRLNRKAA